MLCILTLSQAECVRRLGADHGSMLWEMSNSLFDYLPLAARVEKKILILHGGLGATLTSLGMWSSIIMSCIRHALLKYCPFIPPTHPPLTDQLQTLSRPIYDGQSNEEPLGQLLRDILWSDPTASDTITGLHDSPRGTGIALFGPDRVKAFCRRNDIDIVVRSHQVVDAGYEFFAGKYREEKGRVLLSSMHLISILMGTKPCAMTGKQLITVFSATDYCGQHKNDGAILEIDRDLVITPKLVSNNKTSQWAMSRNSSPPRTKAASSHLP